MKTRNEYEFIPNSLIQCTVLIETSSASNRDHMHFAQSSKYIPYSQYSDKFPLAVYLLEIRFSIFHYVSMSVSIYIYFSLLIFVFLLDLLAPNARSHSLHLNWRVFCFVRLCSYEATRIAWFKWKYNITPEPMQCECNNYNIFIYILDKPSQLIR